MEILVYENKIEDSDRHANILNRCILKTLFYSTYITHLSLFLAYMDGHHLKFVGIFSSINLFLIVFWMKFTNLKHLLYKRIIILMIHLIWNNFIAFLMALLGFPVLFFHIVFASIEIRCNTCFVWNLLNSRLILVQI